MKLIDVDLASGLPDPPPLDPALTAAFTAPEDHELNDLVPGAEPAPDIDLSDLADLPEDTSDSLFDDSEPDTFFDLGIDESPLIDDFSSLADEYEDFDTGLE